MSVARAHRACAPNQAAPTQPSAGQDRRVVDAIATIDRVLRGSSPDGD